MAEAADIPVVTDDMVIEPKKEMDKPRDGSPVRSERGRSPEPRAEREPFSARSRGGAPSSSTGEKAPSIYVRGLGKDCQPADLFPIFEKYVTQYMR